MTKQVFMGSFVMGVLLLLGCVMATDVGIQSPYEKIDDKLWEVMITSEPDFFNVADEMEGSGVLAASVVTVAKYPVIVTYSTINPDAELKIINGDVKELYIQEIIQLSNDNRIEKLYLDSEVELNLNQALPLINGMSIASIAGAGSKVCILDTGLDKSHYALKYPVLEWDFVNNDSDASDDHFHGTHVAGIVVSSDSTYRGVAPAADLMIGKVISSSGSGYYSWIIAGLQWCANNGADVISMSFGGGLYQDTCDQDFLAMVANNVANNQGIVLVASAGNKGNAGGGSPGCASGVIGVGATDKTKGKRESWSSRTASVDVTAPGSQIMSTMPNGGWHAYSGTSMAAPMVSGSVAVLKGQFPDATSDIIKNALYSTSKCHKKNRCEVGEGYGLINVYDACQFIEAGEVADVQDTEATSYQISAQKAVAIVKLGSRYKGFSPSCVDYKTDDYETYLSVSEDGNKYFTAKKYCRERRKYNRTSKKYEYYTKCYERSSSYAPTRNILFYTDEGYPVQVRGSRGRYYFYVWYDTDVDRATRNKAHAWQYKPLRSRDPPLEIVAKGKPSIGCGPCDKLFGVGGGKNQLT